jgi:2-desacetyl-2-hydroxyethyl bacteriochlorophyllide A dehydrogenase
MIDDISNLLLSCQFRTTERAVKSVVKSKPGPGIEVVDLPIPKPSEGEALVKVERVGICGSDLHIYEWTPGYEFLSQYFPLVLGHEFAGEVMDVRTGPGGLFRPGDKVTSETGKMCGRCLYCKQGQGILCEERVRHGRIGLERNGAMAEYVVAPQESLHRVPPGVGLEAAAMAEPAAVALGAVERATLYPGDMVVILGPGPIGLLILQMCRALGAGFTMVVGQETDAHRLKVATDLGADEVFIGDGKALVQKTRDLTEGRGAAVVFEASGAVSAAVSGLEMLRKGGELILVGIYGAAIPMDGTHHLVRQMKTVKGSYGGASLDWDRVLSLMASRKLNLAPMISDVILIDRAQEAFEIGRRKDALKLFLNPLE